MGRQGAKLLLEASERVRTLTQAYFSPERPLHLSFTHLVCRSAIEGNHQETPSHLLNLGSQLCRFHLHGGEVPCWPNWGWGKEHLCLLITPGATGLWME